MVYITFVGQQSASSEYQVGRKTRGCQASGKKLNKQAGKEAENRQGRRKYASRQVSE